jgi:hypothetical protein
LDQEVVLKKGIQHPNLLLLLLHSLFEAFEAFLPFLLQVLLLSLSLLLLQQLGQEKALEVPQETQAYHQMVLDLALPSLAAD